MQKNMAQALVEIIDFDSDCDDEKEAEENQLDENGHLSDLAIQRNLANMNIV